MYPIVETPMKRLAIFDLTKKRFLAALELCLAYFAVAQDVITVCPRLAPPLDNAPSRCMSILKKKLTNARVHRKKIHRGVIRGFSVCSRVFGLFAIAPPAIVLVFLYAEIFTNYWWVLLLYGVWFYYDKDTHRKGGRPQNWLKNCWIWRFYKVYFPLKLEKTENLPADKNYLFGYHPHGLMCFGLANLGTNATGFDKLFPGLVTHPLTLRAQFFIPFRREYLMFYGCSESSETNIRYLLGNPEKGHVAIVCIGGAQEEIETAAGSAKLVLNERKGFIRLALENGADLVPTFTFGENEVFSQLFSNAAGTRYRRFLEFVKSWFGFPIFFCSSWLPKRIPLTTVVGRPVLVKCPVKDPSDALIAEYREKYRQNLVEVFERNKKRFGYAENFHLEFI